MPSSASGGATIYTLSLHDALPIYHILDTETEQSYDDITALAAHICKVPIAMIRSEEHTSELQSLRHLVCRLLLAGEPLSTLFPYTTLFRSITFSIPRPSNPTTISPPWRRIFARFPSP